MPLQEKLGKLECYFTPDTEIYATLSDSERCSKIEVTIPVKRKHHPCGRVQQRYVCFHRSGRRDHRTPDPSLQKETDRQKSRLHSLSPSSLLKRQRKQKQRDAINIVKTKRFGMKPMFPEDACVDGAAWT